VSAPLDIQVGPTASGPGPGGGTTTTTTTTTTGTTTTGTTTTTVPSRISTTPASLPPHGPTRSKGKEPGARAGQHTGRGTTTPSTTATTVTAPTATTSPPAATPAAGAASPTTTTTVPAAARSSSRLPLVRGRLLSGVRLEPAAESPVLRVVAASAPAVAAGGGGDVLPGLLGGLAVAAVFGAGAVAELRRRARTGRPV
jgi:hypothetical protein